MQHAHTTVPAPMSESQFLAWVTAQDERYELVEGIAMMQAGATRNHERVAKEVFFALHMQVNQNEFDVNKGDFGVRIRPGNKAGSILLPDVLVDVQTGDGTEKVTETPVVVVEVLSESTDYTHHVGKFELYKLRPSLKQYVVFEQNLPKAYVWDRTDAGWPNEPKVIEGLDKTISFPHVGAQVAMGDVYRKNEPSNEHKHG